MEYQDLMRLAGGHAEARIIQTAVELRIFEAFGTGNQDSTTIASSLHLDLRAAELLLNALAALNLLHKQADGFSLAPVSARYLKSDAPEYLGGMIRFEAYLWRCWEQLGDAVRAGQPVRPPDMYQSNSADTQMFVGAMDSLVKARGDTEMLANAFEWDRVTELLDVGSGPATYPIALCRKYSKLRAAVYDLPATLAVTERWVREAGLEHRIRLLRGDYRIDEIPGSYDVIFLSNIIHGEGVEENQRLMNKAAAALKPGGSVIVKDHILDDTRTNPPTGAIFSLLMLLTTRSGRCYTFNEVKSWLEAAGLNKISQVDLPAPLNSSLIIGKKQ